MEQDQLQKDVTATAERARAAAIRLAAVDTATKNKALNAIADAIVANSAAIVKANEADVDAATKVALGSVLIERLTLTADRVKGMADGLREMARLDDPIGEILRQWSRPNGMNIRQVRVPLGVVGMIYESRPNVTVEAAGLCLKAGNAVILRGGSEAFQSNQILVRIASEAAVKNGIPDGAIQLLPPKDRRSTTILSRLNGLVDLIIARGSEEMIRAVSGDATVPVLGHGKGVCHVYIDKSADLEKAVRIAVNAKVQRPGVCNAMESLLIHEYLLYDALPKVAAAYRQAGVEIRGDDRVVGLVPHASLVPDDEWSKEYLDKIVAIKIVDSLDEAIAHINKFGSGHTDSIVTEDKASATAFEKSVDSSCVMVNTSTRLHDGGAFGFGSEIGISTQKLHARGTMGLRELTTTKYIVEGDGQIRE